MTKLSHFSGSNAGDGRLIKINWDDIRVPATNARVAGAADPTFLAWIDDVRIWWFSAAQERELFFAMQIPHGYKLGTDLDAHVHWIPSANGNAGEVVSWGLEYVITDIGGDFPAASTTISGNQHIPADASLVADRHYLTDLGDIDGSGIETVSAALSGRVFRDATGALKTDDYGDVAGLLEIDFHFQMDSVGSWEETAKGF